jgi:peptide/nickel transport system substrate-binding protein
MDVANSTSYFHTFSPIDANRDAELNDILQRADSATAESERRALYAEALRQIAEKAYVLPLYTIVDYQVANADLMIGPFVGEWARFYEMSYR